MGDMVGLISESANIMTEVIFKNSSGEWPQLELGDQLSDFGGYAVGVFYDGYEKGGTGFVIKVLTSHPTYSALILTAAHCFIGNFNYNPGAQGFVVEDEIYDAIPLKASLDWDNIDLYCSDPIFNSKISIPEDWTICGLMKRTCNTYHKALCALELIDIDYKLTLNEEVFACGYPVTPDKANLNYLALQRHLQKI